jgi:zinc/manganese transport system substrate-binding protein/manganese/iron transport system substrate-binding protein
MPVLVRLALAGLILGVTAIGVAAAGDDGATGAGPLPRVVATTTQAADLVRNVAGDRAHVTALITANADPHGYELRPRDARALADADLVVRSGGDLDDWLEDAIDQAGGDAPVLTLMDGVRTLEDDPHWWQDPRNALLAVGEIERALNTAAPEYRARIERLDRAASGCWERVPPRQRKLVTTHDALAYYARAYGLEVVGTVIPSLSTQGQASAGELSALAETVRREGVRAVFPESSVNSKVERAIAEETGAEVGGELWADTLGPAGSDGATYVQSIAANTRTLVDGVTGGAVSCPAL